MGTELRAGSRKVFHGAETREPGRREGSGLGIWKWGAGRPWRGESSCSRGEKLSIRKSKTAWAGWAQGVRMQAEGLGRRVLRPPREGKCKH